MEVRTAPAEVPTLGISDVDWVHAAWSVPALVGIIVVWVLAAAGAIPPAAPASCVWIALLVPFALALAALLGACPMCCVRPSYAYEPNQLLSREEEAKLAASERRFDEFVMIGTHNSCHIASLISLFVKKWRYTHPPMLAQLGMGIRHLEFDIWYRRFTGKWIMRHEGLVDALMNSGNWDRSFVGHLRKIEQWSRDNAGHFPLVFNLDVKGSIHECDFRMWCGCINRDLIDRVPRDKSALDALQDEVLSVWPRDRIFCPSDVIQGGETLLDALKARGWPAVRELRGKTLMQINIYGTVSPVCEVADKRFFWVRGPQNGNRDDCVYTENTASDPVVMLRGGPFNYGELFCGTALGQSSIAEGEARLASLRESGARLLVSDCLEHLVARCPASVYPITGLSGVGAPAQPPPAPAEEILLHVQPAEVAVHDLTGS